METTEKEELTNKIEHLEKHLSKFQASSYPKLDEKFNNELKKRITFYKNKLKRLIQTENKEKELLKKGFSFNFKSFSVEETKQINSVLIKYFPFLLPRDSVSNSTFDNYDYEFTELDNMPFGWRISFGYQMCLDIKNCLEKANFLNEYQIFEIKEKWGKLSWEATDVPDSISREYESILFKYEYMSMLYCIKCGKPTEYISDNWITYVCDNCRNEQLTYSKYRRLTWLDIPKGYELNGIKYTNPLKKQFKKQWLKPKHYLLKKLLKD